MNGFPLAPVAGLGRNGFPAKQAPAEQPLLLIVSTSTPPEAARVHLPTDPQSNIRALTPRAWRGFEDGFEAKCRNRVNSENKVPRYVTHLVSQLTPALVDRASIP